MGMVNDDIKDILRSIPAVLVMEDGQPSYVVTEYETWRQLATGEQVRVSNGRPGHLSPRPGRNASDPLGHSRTGEAQEAQVLERLNKEILSLREQIQMQEEATAGSAGGD